MSKSVNVDFVTRQIEVDTDGKEHFISAAMAAKDAEQSMLSAQNAAKEVKEIYGDGNFTPLSDLLGGLGTKLKRWGSIFANKVFASNLPIVYNSVAEMKADTMLWEGMNTKTLGYYTPNDGGGASYLIRAKADSDVDDGGSLHELANGLVAELIVENGTVYPEQFGAKGDGVSDDTNAIQTALDTHSIVLFANKTYMIDASVGIRPNNGNGLFLAANTVLKAIPNSLSEYNVIRINYKENVYIFGGTILGERQEHSGTSGESGHCINIRNSKHITIKNTKCFYGYGDGIFVGSDQNTTMYPNDIKILNTEIGYCRRNGIALTTGENLIVDNCYIHNIDGVEPKDCIDIEPNYKNEYIRNCVVRNCVMDGMLEIHITASTVENDVAVTNCNCRTIATVIGERVGTTYVNIDNCTCKTIREGLNLQNAGENAYVNFNNIRVISIVEGTPTIETCAIYFAGINKNITVRNMLAVGKYSRLIQKSEATPPTYENINLDIKTKNYSYNYNSDGVSNENCETVYENLDIVTRTTTSDYYPYGGVWKINGSNFLYFNISNTKGFSGKLKLVNLTSNGFKLRKASDFTGKLLKNGEEITEAEFAGNVTVNLDVDGINNCISIL